MTVGEKVGGLPGGRGAQQILGRAQEEIRAERDRVFQELKAQVGDLSLALATPARALAGAIADQGRGREVVLAGWAEGPALSPASMLIVARAVGTAGTGAVGKFSGWPGSLRRTSESFSDERDSVLHETHSLSS